MKGYAIKHLRCHVGVYLTGQVVTSVDTERLSCQIERTDDGFIVFHKGRVVWVPDTNVIFADLEPNDKPKSGPKAA